MQRVTTNNVYYIRNENFPDQHYYTTEMKFSSNSPDKNNRIVLELKERGEIGIIQEGEFGINNTINLILSENKAFQNLIFCLKWSEMLIFVNAVGDGKLQNPFDDNYKCYNPEVDLNEKSGYNLSINYDMIGSLTSSDYIRVQFYDNDEILSQNYTKRQEYWIKAG
jgi:hypothetical protein